MPFKDKVRKAIRRSIRTGSSSNSSSFSNTSNTSSSNISSDSTSITTSPSPTPSPTPTNSSRPNSPSKSSSRLSLTRSLSFRFSLTTNPAEKQRRKLEEWAKRDAEEWDSMSRGTSGHAHSRHKSQTHQDMLRSYEIRFREESDGEDGSFGRRRGSFESGISPGGSRRGSVDLGEMIGEMD